jgi:nicotinamidase-related amidase
MTHGGRDARCPFGRERTSNGANPLFADHAAVDAKVVGHWKGRRVVRDVRYAARNDSSSATRRPSGDHTNMSSALIVVDVQNGFINEYTCHIPDRVAKLIEGGDYSPILYTRFINMPDGPYPRFVGWDSFMVPPEIDLVEIVDRHAARDAIFDKHGYAGMPEALERYLLDHDIDRVTLVGIDTDMCVLKVAMDAFDLNIEPTILIDCCASTAGLQSHLAGLAVLARNIGAQQLRDAGLGEGRLAAPEPTAHRS